MKSFKTKQTHRKSFSSLVNRKIKHKLEHDVFIFNLHGTLAWKVDMVDSSKNPVWQDVHVFFKNVILFIFYFFPFHLFLFYFFILMFLFHLRDFYSLFSHVFFKNYFRFFITSSYLFVYLFLPTWFIYFFLFLLCTSFYYQGIMHSP